MEFHNFRAFHKQSDCHKYGEIYRGADSRFIFVCVLCKQTFYESVKFFNHLSENYIVNNITVYDSPRSDFDVTHQVCTSALVVQDVMRPTELKKKIQFLQHKQEFLPEDNTTEKVKSVSQNVEATIRLRNIVDMEAELLEEVDQEHSLVMNLIPEESNSDETASQPITQINAQSLVKQEIYIRPSRPFQCLLCGKRMKSNAALEKHNHRFHSKESDSETIICDFCKKLILRKNLRLHQNGVRHKYKLQKHLEIRNKQSAIISHQPPTLLAMPGSIAASLASNEMYEIRNLYHIVSAIGETSNALSQHSD